MAEIYPASVILSILLCHSEAQPKNLCGCSSRLRLLCAGAAALGLADFRGNTIYLHGFSPFPITKYPVFALRKLTVKKIMPKF